MIDGWNIGNSFFYFFNEVIELLFSEGLVEVGVLRFHGFFINSLKNLF